MAEKEGFEPPVPFPVQLISSQSHSATLPLLLTKAREQNETPLKNQLYFYINHASLLRSRPTHPESTCFDRISPAPFLLKPFAALLAHHDHKKTKFDNGIKIK